MLSLVRSSKTLNRSISGARRFATDRKPQAQVRPGEAPPTAPSSVKQPTPKGSKAPLVFGTLIGGGAAAYYLYTQGYRVEFGDNYLPKGLHKVPVQSKPFSNNQDPISWVKNSIESYTKPKHSDQDGLREPSGIQESFREDSSEEEPAESHGDTSELSAEHQEDVEQAQEEQEAAAEHPEDVAEERAEAEETEDAAPEIQDEESRESDKPEVEADGEDHQEPEAALEEAAQQHEQQEDEPEYGHSSPADEVEHVKHSHEGASTEDESQYGPEAPAQETPSSPKRTPAQIEAEEMISKAVTQNLEALPDYKNKLEQACINAASRARALTVDEVASILSAEEEQLDVDGGDAGSLQRALQTAQSRLQKRRSEEALRAASFGKRLDTVWKQQFDAFAEDQWKQLETTLEKAKKEAIEIAQSHSEREVEEWKRFAIQKFETEYSRRLSIAEARFAETLKQESERLYAEMQSVSEGRQADIEHLAKTHEAIKNDLRDRIRYERDAKTMHRMTVALLELERALASPKPVSQALECLRVSSSRDGLLGAVVETLPSSIATKGVPSVGQLQERWKDVARVGLRTALGPESGGLAGYLFGTVMSYLVPKKADNELENVASLSESAKTLVKASEQVERGDLSSALRTLEDLSGATKSVVADWAKDAESRVVVEQALTVVRSELSLQASRAI